VVVAEIKEENKL